jgi:CDGSH-type Zn-finger protein
MALMKITVRKNGPYRIEAPSGVLELVDFDDNKYDLSGKGMFSLCRCGRSAKKPFCDGAHKIIGFQAADAAIVAEEKQDS